MDSIPQQLTREAPHGAFIIFDQHYLRRNRRYNTLTTPPTNLSPKDFLALALLGGDLRL
jgi:hypothetical protein